MRETLAILLCLISFFVSPKSNAQVVMVEDKTALDNVRQNLTAIYGYNFADADVYLSKHKVKYGGHPSYFMLSALGKYWKYPPITNFPTIYKGYKQDLLQTIALSDAILVKDQHSSEATFFSLMASMMLAKHASDDGDYSEAIGHIKLAFRYIKKGFTLKDKYAEFYFSTGLYDYFRVLYPELNPLYKPFMMFFTAGDKARGLKELEICANTSIYTGPEARIFMARIYLYYENKPEEAYQQGKILTSEFPNNNAFKTVATEACYFNHKYTEGVKLAKQLSESSNPYFIMNGMALQALFGIENNVPQKESLHQINMAIETATSYGKSGIACLGLCYYAAAKSFQKVGNVPQAKFYFKKAEEITQNLIIKEEAKKYINSRK